MLQLHELEKQLKNEQNTKNSIFTHIKNIQSKIIIYVSSFNN